MATAMNTTVKVYKGVPLVKGGTEVLYLSQGAAEGALTGLTKTYTQYYYQRENANSLQVDDPIEALEGCNYMTFVNVNHGNKIFFCFIDSLQYISDSCTQINYTVDPFPTFIGDCKESAFVYVERNTPKTDVRGANLVDDFLPKVCGSDFITAGGQTLNITCDRSVIYFVVKTDWGMPIVGYNTQSLAVLKDTNPSTSTIQGILEDGGTILGCYLVPSSTQIGNYAISNGSDLSISYSANAYRHQKLNTGVYNKVSLTTSQGVKYYEMEDFDNPLAVTFGQIHYSIPTPSILIYPKNYKGVAYNLAEGITIQLPSIPVGIPTVYTQAQAVGDIFGIAGSALTGAIAGATKGGWAGALAGAGIAAASGIAGMALKKETAKFSPMGVTQTNFPLISGDYVIRARLDYCSPKLATMNVIDDYFDYYGYEIDAVLKKADVNTDDGAFLQTGSIYLSGSEADEELNARLMNGIKIRKTLS